MTAAPLPPAAPALEAERAEGVAELLAEGAALLRSAGVPSPETDAQVLVAHVLGLAPAALAARRAAGGTVGTAEASRCREVLARRAARVPLQHLTGHAGFRWLELEVGPGVFVPRPETELLVEPVLRELRGLGRPALVVDLCSGSGAVALAVAAEAVGPPHVVAVENDAAALGWLRRNARARAAAGDPPVQAVAGDLRDVPALLPDLRRRVDVVVSNPPYLPESAVATLDPEVRDHDPHHALVSGPDGLEALRAVASTAAVLLRPGGLLAVEHGHDQGGAVPALLHEAGGWTDVADALDLAGRPRVTTARLAAPAVGAGPR